MFGICSPLCRGFWCFQQWGRWPGGDIMSFVWRCSRSSRGRVSSDMAVRKVSSAGLVWGYRKKLGLCWGAQLLLLISLWGFWKSLPPAAGCCEQSSIPLWAVLVLLGSSSLFPPSFPGLRGPGVGSWSESFNWTCFLAKPVLLNFTTATSPPFLFVLVKGELCNVSSELAVFEHGYELAVQELSDKLFPCTVILQVVYEAELYLTNSVYLNTQFLISTINFKGCLISPVTEREVSRRALAQKQMWGKSNSIPLTASRCIYPHGCPCYVLT